MEGPKQTSQDMWNGEDVLEPSFITIRRPLKSGFCVDLYLQVFEKVSMDKWRSLARLAIRSWFKKPSHIG